MNRRIAPIIALLLTLSSGIAACDGNDKVTAPTPISSPVSPAGNWSGPITDPLSGEGTAQMSLSEVAPPSLTGTWSAAFKNGDSFSGTAVSGLYAPSGYGVILYVAPPPECTFPGGSATLGYSLINATITSTKLTAVASRMSCSGLSFGTISLTKQ